MMTAYLMLVLLGRGHISPLRLIRTIPNIGIESGVSKVYVLDLEKSKLYDSTGLYQSWDLAKSHPFTTYRPKWYVQSKRPFKGTIAWGYKKGQLNGLEYASAKYEYSDRFFCLLDVPRNGVFTFFGALSIYGKYPARPQEYSGICTISSSKLSGSFARIPKLAEYVCTFKEASRVYLVLLVEKRVKIFGMDMREVKGLTSPWVRLVNRKLPNGADANKIAVSSKSLFVNCFSEGVTGIARYSLENLEKKALYTAELGNCVINTGKTILFGSAGSHGQSELYSVTDSGILPLGNYSIVAASQTGRDILLSHTSRRELGLYRVP